MRASRVQPTGAADLLQLLLQAHDPVGDQAAVGFDLRLARAAQEPEAAALPFQVGPGPDQAAALVVLNAPIRLATRPSLVRAPLSEDVQDQAGYGRSPCNPSPVSRLRCCTGLSGRGPTTATATSALLERLRLAGKPGPRPAGWRSGGARNGSTAVCTTVKPMEAASPAASINRASAARGLTHRPCRAFPKAETMAARVGPAPVSDDLVGSG